MTSAYLPGELIDTPSSSASVKILCYGIEKNENSQYVATQPGVLRFDNGSLWMSVQSRRYTAAVGDVVIGVVTSRLGDVWKLDIGAVDLGYVSFLSFEGATKRNRPNVKTGDVILARIIQASKHLESELSCVDTLSRSKGLGVLQGGFVFKASLHLCRRLLSSDCQLLKLLGKDYKFEISIGVNGKIWLKSSNPSEIIAIRTIILGAEYVLESDLAEYCEREIRKAKGFSDTPMET